MKKLLLVLAVLGLTTTAFTQKHQKDKALTIVVGKFAFCGASEAKPTGQVINIEGRKFFEGVALYLVEPTDLLLIHRYMNRRCKQTTRNGACPI